MIEDAEYGRETGEQRAYRRFKGLYALMMQSKRELSDRAYLSFVLGALQAVNEDLLKFGPEQLNHIFTLLTSETNQEAIAVYQFILGSNGFQNIMPDHKFSLN